MRHVRGISTLELLIVLVVLGLIAVLAVPRLSRASQPSPDTSDLRDALKVLRVAVERYYQDHNVYPGVLRSAPDMQPSEALAIAQLTLYTDAAGETSPVPTPRHTLGPYLRHGVPPCPVPPNDGSTRLYLIRSPQPGSPPPAPGDAGWIYDARTGHVAVNSDRSDLRGRPYTTY